jgi:hypothetical protein
MIQRRGLLAGLGALLAAPAIIRTPGLLMPVKPPLVVVTGVDWGSGDWNAVAHMTSISGSARWEVSVHLVLPGASIDITDRLPLRIGGKG